MVAQREPKHWHAKDEIDDLDEVAEGYMDARHLVRRMLADHRTRGGMYAWDGDSRAYAVADREDGRFLGYVRFEFCDDQECWDDHFYSDDLGDDPYGRTLNPALADARYGRTGWGG